MRKCKAMQKLCGNFPKKNEPPAKKLRLIYCMRNKTGEVETIDEDKLQEAHLIQRTIQGDRDAFELLMAPYVKALGGYIAYRAKNQSDASDILQETMFSVWRSIGSYKSESTFKTWAYTIARRRLADFYRKDESHLPLSEFGDALPAEDDFGKSITRMDVKSALSKLSDKENELVHLVFHAGLSYTEVSEVMDIPAGTVKSRMAAIKAKLKPLIAKGGHI